MSPGQELGLCEQFGLPEEVHCSECGGPHAVYNMSREGCAKDDIP